MLEADMPASDDQQEKRKANRADLVKLSFIKKGDATLGCLLHDISLSGASVDYLSLPGLEAAPFAIGDEIEIVVDDVGAAHGSISRAWDKGAAIHFKDLSDEEAEFIKSISASRET